MKSSPVPTSRTDAADSQGPRTGRRQLVVGAGVAATAALATAAFAPRGAAPAAAAKAGSDPAQGEGYRLTDHVRRYYETTRS
jgi:hypothetical protein